MNPYGNASLIDTKTLDNVEDEAMPAHLTVSSLSSFASLAAGILRAAVSYSIVAFATRVPSPAQVSDARSTFCSTQGKIIPGACVANLAMHGCWRPQSTA